MVNTVTAFFIDNFFALWSVGAVIIVLSAIVLIIRRIKRVVGFSRGNNHQNIGSVQRNVFCRWHS